MTRVNTTTWQYFNVADYFDMKAGKYYAKDDYQVGDTPLITSSDQRNGIMEMTNLKPLYSHCLTIGKVNMSVFFQEIPFCASSDVTVLMPKKPYSKSVMLFFVTLLLQESYRFNYGNQIRLNDAMKLRIKLPAQTNEPDWEYMEEFISKRTSNYDYAKHTASSLPVPKLETGSWQFYKLSDLFKIETGKDLLYYSSLKGKIPVVGHSAISNGVVAYANVLPDYKIYSHTNSLTLADRGNFFATAQPKDYYLGTRTKALIANFENVNTEVLLFIATVINKEKYRFSYGRVASKRTGDITIKLPAKDGHPDWDYMTSFVQTLPFSSQV